jgi:hypothetical protein
MRIVIAGGSGFLGTHLSDRLRADGHQVEILTRHPARSGDMLWDPLIPSGAWVYSVERSDAVINLAGEPIAGRRWTAARKAAIRRSRVDATRALARAIIHAQPPPRVFLSGSAVGFYGPQGDQPLTEEAPAGQGLLASVCTDWEREAREAADATRVVILRTGLVLDRKGGALPQMARPFWFGAGGPVGSGRQFLSWIHRDDWVEMACWALRKDSVSGPLNVTAPQPVSSLEFARTLGAVLHRPSLLPAPAIALKLMFGELADELLLSGQRVLPAKAQQLGFTFRYSALEPAVRAIYAR